MDNTLAKLEAIRDQLWLLHMEIELREPFRRNWTRSAMKLRESAIEHFGYSLGVAPQYLLSHRVVPDSEAERVEQELKGESGQY